jgi:hypothetical protein
MNNMIWFVLWAIAPLIPAILIYLILPKSSSSVDGVLKGMQIKLGGAAALYFIVFFIMNPVKNGLIQSPSTENRWSLVTSFQDEQNKRIPNSEILRIEPVPDLFSRPLDDNQVLLNLPSVNIDDNKNISIPYYLRFIFTDYETKTISPLEFRNCNIEWNEKILRLNYLPQLLAKKKMDTTLTTPAVERTLNF